MSYSPADLAALRRAIGRGGVQELPDVLPGIVLKVDLGGLAELVRRGALDNVLLVDAHEASQAAEAARQEAQTEDPEAEAPATQQVIWESLKKRDIWHDAVLAAFVVEPHYYRLEELPPGAAPEDGLCLFDFDEKSGVRDLVVSLALNGWEGLAPFRAVLGMLAVGRDGDAAAPAAEQLVPGPGGEPAPDVLAGPGRPAPVGRARKSGPRDAAGPHAAA